MGGVAIVVRINAVKFGVKVALQIARDTRFSFFLFFFSLFAELARANVDTMATVTEPVTNNSGVPIDVVAYPAGRPPAVLGRLNPGQTQSFMMVSGDVIKAFDPATHQALGDFRAGTGAIVVGGAASASSPYGASSYPSASSPYPPSSPTSPTLQSSSSSAVLLVSPLDNPSIVKIKDLLQNVIATQSKALIAQFETLASEMRGQIQCTRPPRPPNMIQAQERRYLDFRQMVINILKLIREAAKEISVHLIMGDITADQQRSIALDLTLALDKLKEAFNLIEKHEMLEVYPPKEKSCCCCCCCGNGPGDPIVVHKLTDDPTLAGVLGEIKKNLDTEGLNLDNMKVKMTDLGGSFTVGGKSDVGFDNSAKERAMRATTAQAMSMTR